LCDSPRETAAPGEEVPFCTLGVCSLNSTTDLLHFILLRDLKTREGKVEGSEEVSALSGVKTPEEAEDAADALGMDSSKRRLFARVLDGDVDEVRRTS